MARFKSILNLGICLGLMSLGAGAQPPFAQSTLLSWGYNAYGQLGDGTNSNSTTPVSISSLKNAVAVAGGDNHSLALTSNGTVWSWGLNVYGQIGDGTYNGNHAIPTIVSSLTGIVAIAAGEQHSLALKNDGTVWAWGDNEFGQFGNGSQTGSATPSPVPGLGGVIAIASGSFQNLALKNDGTVWSWGLTEVGVFSYTPVQVGLAGVVAIACGANHNLALKNDGTVWAWGLNNHGQIGNGTNTGDPAIFAAYGGASVVGTPAQVIGLAGVVAIAGGLFHSLAEKNDGTVWAWGGNDYGQLGNGSNLESTKPVAVSSLTDVIAIASRGWHNLALKSDGTVWAWGNNDVGQLGNGDTTSSSTPVAVTSLAGAVVISSGGRHSLAVAIEQTPVTISSSPFGRMFTLTGTGCQPGSYSTPVTLVWMHNSTCTVSFTSLQSGTGTRYVFSGWSDDGSALASRTLATPHAATTYTANFRTQYLLTTLVSPAATGSISPTTGFFDEASMLPVIATAKAGYAFAAFSGVLSGVSSPQNLTLTAPATVTANFAALPDLTITNMHSGGAGGHFSQGQMGAIYTITVGNNGPGSSRGTVTVTDFLPNGLTLVSMAGVGWTCGTPNPNNVCTRIDALGSGSFYQSINVIVNVEPAAPGSVTNIAAVSGAEDYNVANNTAMDPTMINRVTDVSSQVSVTQNGFARNHATGIWSATMTLTNKSLSSISGPVQVVLTNLSSNAIMVNNTGIRNSWPYITVSNTALAPWSSVNIVIQFANPTNGFIAFTPVTYTGSF